MDEAYETLDKTKWIKLKHYKVMSAFCKSENPFERYKAVTKEVGFQENILTSLDDLHLYYPNEQKMRSKNFQCQSLIKCYLAIYNFKILL